jgi:arabinofuranosyltransferase
MPKPPLSACVVAMLGGALLFAVVRLAWLSDDAYITLRTVENLVAGHGPVWNVGERVQTYTHPLWFGLLAAGRWLTGEHYFTTLALSLAAAVAAVASLALVARRPLAIAGVLLLLLATRAFGDFATSGLETPLAMLLLCELSRADAAAAAGRARPLRIGLLVGLCGLTRLDLLLLAGPLWLGQLRAERPLRRFAALMLALLPLAAFSAWAAFYYGSPFPITAYAKAFAPGVPAGELLVQGGRYVQHTLHTDPLSLLTIGAAIVVGFAFPALRARLWATGILLSTAYVVRVGGDFMAGRFFVPPFVAAVALLARCFHRVPWSGGLAAGIAAGLLWLPGTPPWLRSRDTDLQPVEPVHGIQDERRFYWRQFGLFSPEREIPDPGRFSRALRAQGRERRVVLGAGMAGGLPFVAGELFHFVDPWLCDPLLMRLPVADPAQWRIGHFTRAIPAGYPETIAFGDQRIDHAGLRRFHRALRQVLSAPLLAPARQQALLALWTGAEADGLAEFVRAEYRRPQRSGALLESFAAARAEGSFWFDEEGIRCLHRGGLRLRRTGIASATAMVVQVAPLATYRFVFSARGREVGRAVLPAIVDPGAPPIGDRGDVLGYLRRLVGLTRFPVPLPPGLPAFDTIDIDVDAMPWLQPALGSLQLDG